MFFQIIFFIILVETGALITGSSLFGSVYYDVDQNNPIVASITDSSNGNLSFSPHLQYLNNSLATFLAVQKVFYCYFLKNFFGYSVFLTIYI